MFRSILLGLFLVMTFSCSSESEKPVTDIRIPLGVTSLEELEQELRDFGRENGLVILENDRDQMKVLNSGVPAISFWFSLGEDKKTAINVTTVNEGNFMRVMIFADGFEKDQM